MGMGLNLFSLIVVTEFCTPSPSKGHQISALTTPGPNRLFLLNLNLEKNDIREENTWILYQRPATVVQAPCSFLCLISSSAFGHRGYLHLLSLFPFI